MQFVVLGTSDFTLRSAEGILDSGGEITAIISLSEELLPDNSADLASFSRSMGIPYYEVKDINSDQSSDIISRCSPDYIFSSWPKIIQGHILSIPKYYCIGTHPTELPYNRGRHPLHWLITMGIQDTKLSFFLIDEGVDTGNILLQVSFVIDTEDYIDTAAEKMNRAAYEGTFTLCKKLEDELRFYGVEQEQEVANYWRKRTPYDVTLDMRMSAGMIVRTVRSFAPPYSCANLIFRKYVIKIVRARSVERGLAPDAIRRIEPGRIIEVVENMLVVKVEDGFVELKCKTLLPRSIHNSTYIYPPMTYLAEWYDILIPQLS
jgi:methionyl-tRNA formyltransferase